MITGADSKVVLERWVFNVETDKSVRADGYVDWLFPTRHLALHVARTVRHGPVGAVLPLPDVYTYFTYVCGVRCVVCGETVAGLAPQNRLLAVTVTALRKCSTSSMLTPLFIDFSPAAAVTGGWFGDSV